MKHHVLSRVLAVAVVALSVAAFSAPASAQFYAGGRGGAFLPNNADDGLNHFNTGFGLEAFAGMRLMPYFGVEAGIGYLRTRWNVVETENEDETITVSAIPLTLTAKGFFPLGDAARLYAGAGVGAYFAKNTLDGTEFGADVSFDTKATAFGVHAVVGGEYLVTPHLGLEAEVKWFVAKPDFTFDVADEQLQSGKFNIGGFLLNLGVLFQL